MLRVRSKVKILKVKSGLLSKTADDFFRAQFNNALRAWVTAILARIPDYTGTARGTFIPVARALKPIIGGVPSGPVFPYNEEWRSRHKQIGYKIIRGRGRFNLGEAAGEKYSKFNIDYKKGRGVFTYTNNLPWVLWNEVNFAPEWITLPSNPPWGAIAAGNKAFKDYFITEMPKRQLYKKMAKVAVESSTKSP